MKVLILSIILAATLASCSGEQQKSSISLTANGSPTPTITPLVHITPPVKTANTEIDSSTETVTAAPVEFTYTGVAPDKESLSYKIKVNTAKPISQVDVGIKYLDEQGKVISETTRAWQNIVKSKRQSIEQGKTYDDTVYLDLGSTKAECKLKRVIFTDGSIWSAQ